MEKQVKSVFEELNAINVQDYVKQKQNGGKTLTYLSWSYAVSETLKRYPDMHYEVRHWDGKPYLEDPVLGYMVETSVTIEGITRTMWLPVMDCYNEAIKTTDYQHLYKDRSGKVQSVPMPPATMVNINKAIMRCLVKNLAMFGLGMYIYTGDDLPEDERMAIGETPETPTPENDERIHIIGMIGKANSKDDLMTLWTTYVEYQSDPIVSKAFTKRKKELKL